MEAVEDLIVVFGLCREGIKIFGPKVDYDESNSVAGPGLFKMVLFGNDFVIACEQISKCLGLDPQMLWNTVFVTGRATIAATQLAAVGYVAFGSGLCVRQ